MESSTRKPNRKVKRQVQRAGADVRVGDGGDLFDERVLVVHQKARLLGSTAGFAVFDQGGRQLAIVEEVSRGLGTKIKDRALGQGDSNRTYHLRIRDMNGNVVLSMIRPEMWFTAKSKMTIRGPSGAPIGDITRQANWRFLDAAAGAYSALQAIRTRANGLPREISSTTRAPDANPAKQGQISFDLESRG